MGTDWVSSMFMASIDPPVVITWTPIPLRRRFRAPAAAATAARVLNKRSERSQVPCTLCTGQLYSCLVPAWI